MNRENNAAVQQSKTLSTEERSSGVMETTKTTSPEEESLDRLDLLNAELDAANSPEDPESQRRLVALKAKARESESRLKAEQAKIKPEDMEKFAPLLEAINAEADANTDLRAAERAKIIAELQAEAARDRAEKAEQAISLAELVKATDAAHLEEQKVAILKTLDQMSAEADAYRPKLKTLQADADYHRGGTSVLDHEKNITAGMLDQLNADIDANQDKRAAKSEQWDAKRQAAIGRTDSAPEQTRKDAPKPPELSPEQRAERAAERAKKLAERVDEAMRLSDEAKAAWDKTATELDQAFWSESTDDKVMMPLLDKLNAKLDADATAEYSRTLGVIDEIDESLDKNNTVELKRKVAMLRSTLNAPKPPQKIERQVSRALDEARAARRQKQIEAIKAEAAEDRQKHLEEAFGTGWTPVEMGVFERGEFDAATPAARGYETEKDGGTEFLVKRRSEEVGRIIAENALTPERKLETAKQIEELERKGHELMDKCKLEETKLNHLLGMSVKEAKDLEFASDKKSVLSRMAIGFRKIFAKDVLGEQQKAYNEALIAFQDNEEKVADLKMILENPQEATDVAAIRFIQRLRRSGTGGRLPTIHI